MADPLSLLREYNVNKKEVIERDNQIIFGEVSWPKNVETNFRIKRSCKQGKNNREYYYTLECLLYFLKNKQLYHPEYRWRAADANIPGVRYPDRKQLLSYLNGETGTYPSIDKNAPLDIQTKFKRTRDKNRGESAAKKPHTGETRMQKVQERLDAPKEASVSVDNIKLLSEALSVEEIAAIKAKRLAKKRSTIENTDYSDTFEVVGPDFRAIFYYDVGLTKCNISQERQWKTRTTVLSSNGKVKQTYDNNGSESAATKPHIGETHMEKVHKQLAAQLDASKETSVLVDNIKSLSEAFSVEEIAEIKAKRLAKKSATI